MLQKTRPTMDALQQVVNSFKLFEKKMDKLQDDVSYQGQTLNDLRVLVANLSAGTLSHPDLKPEEKRNQKKNTAIQYDSQFEEPTIVKMRRKAAIQPFPAKIKARSFESQGNRMYEMPYRGKLSTSPNGIPVKSHKSLRSSKTEAPRKATMLRTVNKLDKMRTKKQKTPLHLPVIA